MIMHKLFGMLDGSIPQPTSQVLSSLGMPQSNPVYGYWLQVDQLLHAWLFATISKDTLSKVRDLPHSIQVW